MRRAYFLDKETVPSIAAAQTYLQYLQITAFYASTSVALPLLSCAKTCWETCMLISQCLSFRSTELGVFLHACNAFWDISPSRQLGSRRAG